MLNPHINPSSFPESIIRNIKKPIKTGTEVMAKLKYRKKKPLEKGLYDNSRKASH